MNFFERINATIENAEGSIITLVTTLIPWLAPALPAWLTWYHLTGMLQIPPSVAVAMALTVEFLGLSAVSTAFAYMRHNKINRAAKNRVNLAFPIGAYLFYLLVVVTVNVVQEIPMNAEQQQVSRVISIALLTTISAPAFVIAIARDQQRKIENELDNQKLSTDKNDNTDNSHKPTSALTDAERFAIENNVSLSTAYRRLRSNGHKKEKESII